MVIGNANYDSIGNLKNPVNDARGMYYALKDVDFDSVLYVENGSKKKMNRAIGAFNRVLKREHLKGKETVALFYYSGHGAQYGDENYLLPVTLNDQVSNNLDTIFASDTIKVNDVMDGMEKAKSTMQIVILDACRDNPLQTKGNKIGSKNVGKGLAWIDNSNRVKRSVPKGTFIAYATSPHNVALDEGRDNSPYTKHLLTNIRTKGLSIENIFKKVRKSLISETNGRQVPREDCSLDDDFYFAGFKRRRIRSG
ncbi:caspase family protein [Candidatus Marithrix sp. Canyon 246]|uniref:caspase family protein n=1 Tax=Candidatus Marithrix sp. Canyon 246 TaxID=1827136 RepID=UPI00084A14FD|nr:caspase family protein [Candidatus Marithrix sp. Canyon 246]